MDVAGLKNKLIKEELSIFRELGLVNYPEVIVETWDPYAISDEPPKTTFTLRNAWLRLNPDGEVVLESTGNSYFIPKRLAEHLSRENVPFHHLEHADVYETKLERDLMRKPMIPIPERIELNAGVIPYGKPVLAGLIISALRTFGKGKATKSQIIDFLTKPYPYGGGWLKRTPSLVQCVERTLKRMVNIGELQYDPQTKEYSLVEKPSATIIGGAPK